MDINDKKQKIFELRQEKKTYQEIASILGVTRQRIHQIYKGYIGYHPDKINSIRVRDNYKCVLCGNNKKLETHHILGRNIENANHPSNLVTLCRKCHIEVETEDRKVWKTPEPKYSNNQIMTKKDQIIKEYNKTKLVHPSLSEIASVVGVFKSYVWKVINEYKNQPKGKI